VKIFDTFPFFNETEILELRLMELDPIVDYFVIAEANRSHNGTPKEFIFEKEKERFAKWLPKIIYVKIEDMPDYDPKEIFKLEYFQRNALIRGLKGKAQAGDKILLSDCDEIPNIEEIEKNLNAPDWMGFKQDLFYYFVNNKVHRSWCGTVMANYGSFGERMQRLRWFAIRRQLTKEGPQLITKGGWHYSYMTGGDAARVRDKVALFAEKDLLARAGSVEEVAQKINTQQDLYGRTTQKGYYRQEIIDISSYQPKMLTSWLAKYPNFIYEKL
jgi:beta-1,4-mannosyl-glycoprotein beta-1,4-N-acetylglucosaminyltransferase